MDRDMAEMMTYQGIEATGRFYSMYRGIVIENIDPNHMNSLLVAIPDVQGGIIIWALPFAQHGGLKTGFKYLAPEIGDTVWVMFEYGNPSKPIWTYCGWSQGQIPKALDDPNTMGFITPNGNKVILRDQDGVLEVETEGNIKLKSDKGVVQINDGKNEGTVKIKELTDKLNKTIKELEALRSQFNAHTHSGVTTGGGVSGPTPQQVTSPFSTFNKTDYEDKNCTH